MDPLLSHYLVVPGQPDKPLLLEENKWVYRDHKQALQFPIFKGIPIFIDPNQSIFTQEDFLEEKSLYFDISKQGRFLDAVKKIIPPLGYNHGMKERYTRFLNQLKSKTPEPKILILGGSIETPGANILASDPQTTVVETDVSYGPRTQAIVDGHAIPYQSGVFDGVVAHAVLEHVVDARQVVREIHRVLKPEGLVYADTPFMQHVHGGAYDFVRFSHSGHRRLFRSFEEIESGASAGAGTVMLWSYEYLFLSLLGYHKIAKLLIKAFCRYTGFWLPWLDRLILSRRKNLDAASGNYFIGSRSEHILDDRDLIPYYHQQ